MEWIDVKDRLPENVTSVLAYGSCCGCSYMFIAEVENNEWFLTGSGEEPSVAITHWMPLPSPPGMECGCTGVSYGTRQGTEPYDTRTAEDFV